MKKVLGFLVIAFGIFLQILWLGVCFGTIIIGIVLLIFAPKILFFPFTFFLVIGLAMIGGGKFQNRANFKYQNYDSLKKAPQSRLEKHYEVLESNSSDSMETIKSNYRRLVKEYHYDSIASKNLPEDMLKFAQKKTQNLNEAYNSIKEARG